MPNRKQYYKLDDVGFLGVAVKRSAVEIETDAKKTSDYIKSLRAESGVTAGNIFRNNGRKSAAAGKVKVTATSAKKRTHQAKSK